MFKKNKKILGVFFLFTFFLFPIQIVKAVPAPTCGQEPADVVLMLDRTGSISNSDRANEIAAANSLLSKFAALNNGQRAAIGHFGKNSSDSTAEIVTSLTTVTPGNLASLQGNVSSALSSSGGYTNLSSAISVAQAEITANATTTHHVIILISDGQANRPSPDSNAITQAQNAATTAKGTGTRIVTIAYGDNGHGSLDISGRALLAQMSTQPSADDQTNPAHDVTLAERDAENGDGDDFFIAPSDSGLTTLLNQISDTITCNDGDPCTLDTCGDGNVCTYEAIPGCVACQSDANCNDSNPCTNDSCGTDNICHHSDLENGTTCDDGNLCSTGNTCQGGACSAGTAVVCTASDSCHNAGTCNPLTGLCSSPPKEDGSVCGDGDACNGNETCQQGSCVPGTPVLVDDDNPCTTDYCGDDGLAHHDNVGDGTLCNDDENACNGINTCQQGVCTETTNSVECTASDVCHNAGACDPAAGLCSNPPKENGVSCSDVDVCNGNEACQNGECVAGTPVNCDDSNPCTTDSCGEGGSCNHIPIVGTVECPGVPVCGNGILESGEACDDGNLVDGDECEGDCSLPQCGNGIVDSSLEEQCDDGNFLNGDGCSSTCSPEIAAAAIVPSGPFPMLEGGATATGGCMLTSESARKTEMTWILAILGISVMSLFIKRSNSNNKK